jgi:ribosome-binding protein aMBF1 (putative translation factor)
MTCSVCGRPKSQHLKVSAVDIDGVQCRVCEECAGDMFRRKRAKEIALGLPRSCECSTCQERANGGGQTASAARVE